MMFVIVLLSLLFIIGAAPRLGFGDATGVFMEGLPAEFRTATADADQFRVAALNDDGCHPVELGHFLSALEAVSLRAKGHQQPWCQGRPGTREAAKDGSVGMLVHGQL